MEVPSLNLQAIGRRRSRLDKLKSVQQSLKNSPLGREASLEQSLLETSRASKEVLRKADTRRYQEIVRSRQNLISQFKTQVTNFTTGHECRRFLWQEQQQGQGLAQGSL